MNKKVDRSYGDTIDIYGLRIQCEAKDAELSRELIRPFNFFRKELDTPKIIVHVRQTHPPYGDFPSIKASYSTPRNIVFKDRDCKIIDYFGKGVVIESNDKTTYRIYGLNADFLKEAFYLLVLSLFGEYCDRHGMLRVHALVLSYDNRAFLAPIPPGGGKSTIALAMLQQPGFKLVSDDEAIIDRSGYILPFPLRIGVLNRDVIRDIPDHYVYAIDRMEFGLKYFVDMQYWGEKVETKPLKESVLIISERMLNGTPSIRRTSSSMAIKVLIRDAVIGIGLYQGLEFILTHSSWDIIRKVRTAGKRFMKALRFAFSVPTYRFIYSGDIASNTTVLRQFIHSL
jgi:hypothetical protein